MKCLIPGYLPYAIWHTLYRGTEKARETAIIELVEQVKRLKQKDFSGLEEGKRFEAEKGLKDEVDLIEEESKRRGLNL